MLIFWSVSWPAACLEPGSLKVGAWPGHHIKWFACIGLCALASLLSLGASPLLRGAFGAALP